MSAVVATIVRDGVTDVLSPWEVDYRSLEKYHEQRSPDCYQCAGNLGLAPSFLYVYYLHPCHVEQEISNLNRGFFEKKIGAFMHMICSIRTADELVQILILKLINWSFTIFFFFARKLEFYLSMMAFTNVTVGNMLVSAEEKLADVLLAPM